MDPHALGQRSLATTRQVSPKHDADMSIPHHRAKNRRKSIVLTVGVIGLKSMMSAIEM